MLQELPLCQISNLRDNMFVIARKLCEKNIFNEKFFFHCSEGKEPEYLILISVWYLEDVPKEKVLTDNKVIPYRSRFVNLGSEL